MFFLLLLLDERRIRIRREAQKQMNPQHWLGILETDLSNRYGSVISNLTVSFT
jgi:hypothetical protein